ncbi:MAG: alpha/beta hydrolase-fold protein [Myxococcales bacterium]|jgi:enterochelin esterase-like enzyme
MRIAGRLDRHRFESKLLRDNPLGDPTERELLVYVPPDSDGRRLPVIMLLAGYGSTGASFANYSFFEPNPVERFDRLVREGQSAPALLVMPDAINRWGGSQFVDSTATGPYQRYLADEVVPFIDGAYSTAPVREGRAVVGRSSGGFGALRLGIDRPEVFGAIGSHAGDAAFEISILPELRDAAIAFDRAGGVGGFLERFEQSPTDVPFAGLMIMAYAAAYAPAPGAPPPHCELPFEITTGEVRPGVWARFLEHDPLERIRHDDGALRQATAIFLDAGDRDEHGLHFGTRMIAQLLQQRGIDVVAEEFPGGHRGTAYRYERSLPLLAAACRDAIV